MVRTRSQLAQTPDAPCGTAKAHLAPLEPSFNNQKNNLRPSNYFTPSAEQSFRQRSITSVKYPPEQSQESNGKLQEEMEGSEDDGEEMYKWGYILLVGSTLAFSIGIWSIAIGPNVDTKGLWILDALATDTYYKYLLILLIPVTTCYVIINWWGLKIFRHA